MYPETGLCAEKTHIGFISTTVREVKKNTIPTPHRLLGASATTPWPWSYCSALTHTLKYVPLALRVEEVSFTQQGVLKSVKGKGLLDELGLPMQVGSFFFFFHFWGFQTVSTHLLGFLHAFWQCCLKKGAICTVQSHMDIVVSIKWLRELPTMPFFFKGNVYKIQFPSADTD